MIRIEWDPLDAAIATCVSGVVRIHEGASTREIARNAHDVRWLADGPIITVEERGHIRWRRDDKVVAETYRTTQRGVFLGNAVIAADGTRFLAFDVSELGMRAQMTVESPQQGTLFRPSLDGVFSMSPWTAAISGNGARIAIGYDTDQAGRGVAIWDVDDEKLLDRTWAAQPIDREATAKLELDLTGKRLVTAVPEVGVPSLGAIRIGAGEIYPRKLLGGVSAVAIELRGQLAAYAYREVPAGARGRLRFDYLSPNAKGDVGVEILDTQTLEHELPDIAAMAFSRDRRRLACLASTGAIEIVPVP